MGERHDLYEEELPRPLVIVLSVLVIFLLLDIIWFLEP